MVEIVDLDQAWTIFFTITGREGGVDLSFEDFYEGKMLIFICNFVKGLEVTWRYRVQPDPVSLEGGTIGIMYSPPAGLFVPQPLSCEGGGETAGGDQATTALPPSSHPLAPVPSGVAVLHLPPPVGQLGAQLQVAGHGVDGHVLLSDLTLVPRLEYLVPSTYMICVLLTYLSPLL